MAQKKYSLPHIIFIAIILSVFAGPFVYRTVTFYNDLSEYDYQDLPPNLNVGDQIKTILEIKEDYSVKVYRDRRLEKSYRGYTQISDRIVDYEAPGSLEIYDEYGKSMLLKIPSDSIFKKILDARSSSEVTDSLVLYIFEEKNENYDCYEVVKGNDGESKKGKKIDIATVQQFSLDDQSDEINELNLILHNMDYEERLEKKAPALLFNHQESMNGLLVFGLFEVTNTSPLTVNCISYISHKHSEELKASVWSHWFSGLVSYFGLCLH